MFSCIRRTIAAATLLTLVNLPVSGCGYFLYPERRGNQSGSIHAPTMVMDLLWLLAGIVPGVVALVVDFSSGAIYVQGQRALVVSPDSHISVRLPQTATPTRLEFRLVTDERVLSRKTVTVGPETPVNESIEMRLDDALSPNTQAYLEVESESGVTSRFPTALAMAR